VKREPGQENLTIQTPVAQTLEAPN